MIFTLKFCFDLYANLIFSVLYGTNKILRAIALLFNSKILQSFEGSSGKFISFQSSWLIKDLIFDILWGIFSMFSWFNVTPKAYGKQLLSLFFGFTIAFIFLSHSRESIYYSRSLQKECGFIWYSKKKDNYYGNWCPIELNQVSEIDFLPWLTVDRIFYVFALRSFFKFQCHNISSSSIWIGIQEKLAFSGFEFENHGCQTGKPL